MGNQICWHTER